MKKLIMLLVMLLIPTGVFASPVTDKTPRMLHKEVFMLSMLADINREVSIDVTQGATMAWFSVDGAEVIMTLKNNKIDTIYVRTPVSGDLRLIGERLGYATALVLTAIGADYKETTTIANTDKPVVIKKTQKKVQKKMTLYSGYVVFILRGENYAKV